MKRAMWLGAILGLALSSARAEDKAPEAAPPAEPAAAAPVPAAPGAPRADEGKLKQARELMEKAQKETDPAKRAALMQEHMKLMREAVGTPTEGAAKLPEGLKAMQELMAKIRAEQDPKKREKLVKENAEAIGEHLGRQPMPMGLQPSGAMAGMGAPSGSGAGGPVIDRLERIEKKLDELAKQLESLKK